MTPRRIAITLAVAVLAVASVPLAGCGGGDSAADQSARKDSLNVAKPDVTIAVAGTNGAGDVVVKAVGKGVNIAIHKPVDGKPTTAGDKVVVGTTNAKGIIKLFAFQPGQYVLVGPHGEQKPITVNATQKALPVAFAVCVSGCAG